ncbi:hypothetical protein HN748_03980 [Candidatus Peregrinibacteria bacterium]|jgi:beta-glucosidase-like glycosyl hydrolase|nr:hypothetical protein [Candidatus Peregrinibacteria bacterium]MBT7483259.1 hypothetical protein [Candidatus Peregrinibacteria bacterium]MBT7703368.1 hypothetical protein [Candidatus Peregrinibacteria bacterium]
MAFEDITKKIRNPEDFCEEGELSEIEDWDFYAEDLIYQIEEGYFSLEEELTEILGGEEAQEVLNNYLDEIETIITEGIEEDLFCCEDFMLDEVRAIYFNYLIYASNGNIFSIEELPLKTRLGQMFLMTQYESKAERALALDRHKEYAEIGAYHVYYYDAESLEEAKQTTGALNERLTIPPLISYDFEGGLVRPIKMTMEDIEGYDFPDRFKELITAKVLNPPAFRHDTLDLIPQYVEDLFASEWVAFPSQEQIGRLYTKVKDDPEEKTIFLQEYKQYARCIGEICRDVGISINFAPNLDLVPDIDSDNPISRMGRSYSDDASDITALALAYIEGFQEVEGVTIIPKHYVGVGFTLHDLHHGSAGFEGFSEDLYESKQIYQDIHNQLNGFMTTHLVTEMDPVHPVTTSSDTIDDIRSWGFDGVLMSDDLTMGAITTRYKRDSYDIPYIDSDGEDQFFEVSKEVMAVIDTISAGHDIVFYNDAVGKLDEIIDGLVKMIKYKVDRDGDGEPDLTEARINKSVERLLDLKSSLGLIGSAEAGECSYYYIPAEESQEIEFQISWFEKAVLTKIKSQIKLQMQLREKEDPLNGQTITVEEVMAYLTSSEQELIKRILDINPAILGFPGPYTPDEKMSEVVTIEGSEIVLLTPKVREAFLDLNSAYEKETGKRMEVVSGHRGSGYQLFLFLWNLIDNEFDVNATAEKVALPHYSEHQAVEHMALDVRVEGEDMHDFGDSDAYQWMLERAHEYGFTLSYPEGNSDGIQFEPWHWRFDGIDET